MNQPTSLDHPPILGTAGPRAAHLIGMHISERHLPNAMSFSYPLESGTTVTFFKATPGDTTPRLQMQTIDGDPVDCGAIENPERFGPHATRAQFKTWVERFAEMA